MSKRKQLLDTLRSKSKDDLLTELGSLREERSKLRLKHGSQGVGSPARMKNLRRDVARARTVLRESLGKQS